MTDEHPSDAFDRHLAETEKNPVWQTRQRRIARTRAGRPFNPWTIAPVGLGLVLVALAGLGAILLLGRWMGVTE